MVKRVAVVERVAQALYEVDIGRTVSSTEWSALTGRLVYRGMARAAIEAMREPTDEMVAYACDSKMRPGSNDSDVSDDHARQIVFKRMFSNAIDEALR